MAESLKDIAFYYPGHIWYSTDWIKNMLLFFDGVGLLIPEYKKGEPEKLDPTLAGPLREMGLLHYLVADEIVDAEATEKMTSLVSEAVTAGAFDSFRGDDSAFHAISKSRMGFGGDTQLAERLFEELRRRGLARESQDGLAIPLHPTVRYCILVLLAQILRPNGRALGLDLAPVTDRPEIVKGLQELLELPSVPSSGNVVALDLRTVSVNLDLVPLDEVLGFRSEHRLRHRQYINSARRCARELSLLSPEERVAALSDRQTELDDLASDLERRARGTWRTLASVGLGLIGAAWTLRTGDPFSALLGAGGTILGFGGSEKRETGAFSFLFEAHDKYA